METVKNINLTPIDFKFGAYLSQGFELYKKHFGDFLLAFFFCLILSLIPFCSFLAVGNFTRFCRKKNNNEACEPSEIFNFDDFLPYLIIQAILLGIVFVTIIPLSFAVSFMSMVHTTENAVPVFTGFFILFMMFMVVVLYIVSAMAFYMPAFISLENKKDLKEIWVLSKAMSKGNILIIIAFLVVVSLLSQVGIVLCIIGIFVSMPLYYICQYVAFEDGLNQIKRTSAPSEITKSY